MKKITYLLVLFALFFSSCDPNEEIYDELDGLKQPFKKEVAYTLTSANYTTISGLAKADAVNAQDSAWATLINTYKAFNDSFQAKDYVTQILAKTFPALNKGSVVNATYNHFLNDVPNLTNIATATAYTLVAPADYDAMGTASGQPGRYDNFSATINPDAFLPAFLLTKYPLAVANNAVAITYVFYINSSLSENRTSYYVFDGLAWKPVPMVYTLVNNDYLSMGVPGPGTSNYFTDAYPAESFLPTFLKIKYSFALSGDKRVIIYKFNSSSTIRSLTYMFDGTAWNKYTSIIQKTEQFLNTGEAWIFDPTVKFTMKSNDYQIIVNHDPIPDPSFTNNAWYYGASAYYSNFDLRLSKHVQYEPATFTGLSEDEAMAIMLPRVQEAIVILLKEKYPSAVATVGGFPVHYIVSYQLYRSDLSRQNLKVDYVCTISADGATPAEFELVDGPMNQ